MKKAVVFLMTVAVAVACVCCFAACTPNFDGVYKFESMTANGMTIRAGETYMFFELSEDFFVLEIKKDGTCSVKVSNFNVDESAAEITVSGTWKTDETDKNKILITPDTEDGEEVAFVLEDGKLSANMDGTKFVLKKV